MQSVVSGGGIYINLSLGLMVFFYPEPYICLVPTCFQAPQRYIEKLHELLKYFWIHSCQPHWRQELLSNQLENLRYNQVEEDSDDYVVCIISLYFPPPMTANCLVHGEQQLSPLYLQTFMSISGFLLFPFLFCRCTLYHLLLKSFILRAKAVSSPTLLCI